MQKFDTKVQLIMYFLKGAVHYFVLSACCAALVSLFDMISPRIISFTVDCVIGSDEPALPGSAMYLLNLAGGIDRLKAQPLLIAGAVALVGALAAIFRYLFRSCNARGAQKFVERMRNELFGHIMYLPYTWLGENSTGDIIQRCTSDVQTIRRFISEQMTSLVRTFLLIIMALMFMAQINVRVMLASFAFIPIIVAYSLFFHKKIGSAFEKADIEEGKLSTIAQENLTGVRVVRAFGRETYERERFEEQNTSYTGFWTRLMRLMSAYWSSGDILTGTQTLTVVCLGAYFCVSGRLSAGNYIALISYNGMLMWPVRTLGRVISEMSKAGISIERLRYIMNSEMEKNPENALTPPIKGDLVFDHVSFTYENGTAEVLHDVNFTIKEGQTVGILGGTGSGKSTLMYLLLRLYELPPENGKITIGGYNIADIKASHLRRNIGMVLQEPFLFSRTLSDNIGFALEEQDSNEPDKILISDRPRHTDMESRKNAARNIHMDEIRQAARIASIDDVIESFSEGYDTFVGERGMTLSGGQKQRAAIAQMLIRNTPFMIFDDSLSAVDAETDHKIRTALKEFLSSSTVLLISHRITTLMNADQIIVLDGGRIIETGTHQELLAQNGLYKKIFDLQAAGAEEIQAS